MMNVLGIAKIDDDWHYFSLTEVLFAQHNVFKFYVPVHDAHTMQILETLENTLKELFGAVLLEVAIAADQSMQGHV